MGSPEESTTTTEVPPRPVVSYEGDEVKALERFLLECRGINRVASEFITLADIHNRTRLALGLDPMPVSPHLQSANENYRTSGQR